jgi:hypothetical protein
LAIRSVSPSINACACWFSKRYNAVLSVDMKYRFLTNAQNPYITRFT